MSRTYMLLRGPERHGPYTEDDLRGWLAEGRVIPADRLESVETGTPTTIAEVLGVAFAPPTAAPRPGFAHATPRTYPPGSFRRLFWWALGLSVPAVLTLAAGYGVFFTVMIRDAMRTAQARAGAPAGAPPTPAPQPDPAVVLGAMGVSCLGYVIGAVALVLALVLLYRMWVQVQDGAARTTPGQAVGFLFIPFFNLYWLFIAYRGLAIDLNRRLALVGRPERASVGIATTYCVLAVCSAIPYLGCVVAVAALVLLAVMAWQFIRASEAIAEASWSALPDRAT